MVRVTIALWAVLITLLAATASAHDFSPGVLVLAETEANVFAVAWTAPVDSLGAPAGAEVAFPEGCHLEGSRLHCPQGLSGIVRFSGMSAHRVQVVVTITWRDGSRFERIATGDAPELEIASGRSPILWLRLGIEHILGGLDHLAFVLGLLLVVGFNRGLVAAVTAFTLAHSLTLVLAVTDRLEAPSRPVEAIIGASVLLVAHEAARDRATLTRRHPWVVAFAFGLVHGLGFAGALSEVGFSADEVGFPLLWFNLGVEVGQLACLGALFVMVKLTRRWLGRDGAESRAWPRVAACYALGGLGAFWCIERSAAIFTGWF